MFSPFAGLESVQPRENLPGLGGTNNEPPVMEEIVDYFKDSKIPVYVVFITDGGISKTRAIKDAIRRSANYPIFWKFVGLGWFKLRYPQKSG
ncbi:VWA domain-containing protein [Enterobacter hormaechei]|uniref:VWA domain-containing protein n=1 Tax=Enterobacter hormaechei TaxID=158836 RepID=A0A927DKZ1_9ENTR|nr:VWA domain-containing protein [Enterobacter hormaechei]